MSQKLFEVFLGTYNAAPWIEKVIHSLEAQDCEPFTVKIIDNDSEDQTIEIIKNLFSQYSFKNSYTVIKNVRNIGPISSFLDQLDLFDSEWIVMIHQDDYYHPNHITKLVEGINNASESTSIAFTAMGRIDGQGIEQFSPPTLSSLLSETNRFENFLLSLQIFPINFPACALRKIELSKLTTSRHTTAFNDTELLLKMMCISDVKYIPEETIHYRVFEGNAASVTNTAANDKAVFIGLNELFHSREVEQLISQIESESQADKLVKSIKLAINIRVSDELLKKLIRVTLAEKLNRLFNYKNRAISYFLMESLSDLGLTQETRIIENIQNDLGSEIIFKSSSGNEKPLWNQNNVTHYVQNNSSLIRKFNALNTSRKEKFYNFVLLNPLLALAKRPFVKTWRLRGRSK